MQGGKVTVTSGLLVVIAATVIGAAQTTQPEAPAPPAKAARDRPPPPSAAELAEQRHGMVETQIAHPRGDFRERVADETVLAAMRAVPRHVFVPDKARRLAYGDFPLSIGHGQTISQPYIVAVMTELLKLDADDKVLEIGTGSGYQAAVLAHLTPHVYTIEIVEPLHERAKRVLAQEQYDEISCRRGDGYSGWPEHAPFDAIIVTCAAGHLPPPLWEQLAPGGRIVIPIGGPYQTQRLVMVTKEADGTRRSQAIMLVRFVPMTGEAQR
ncbi:MAG: protein-L-isoaspartate(D-aspartate) O-methyltransferase [Planctomycetota bacterium]|jgi:protein-L-isoaspartate(D-aspartate) O-methyltransferase